MKGVTFGNLHSYRDLNLILAEKVIGTPSPKTELIEIPGSDGVLDFTEFFDGVKYNNRKLSFEFSTIVQPSEFMTLFSTVQNALHGQKMMIYLDDDPEWYYIGRVNVSEWKSDKLHGKLTVDCDCEPYKYRMTSQAVYLCGKNLLNLNSVVNTRPLYWTKTETGFAFDRGTATGNGSVYFEIPVVKGKTYTFSAKGTTFTGGTPSLYVYNNFVERTVIKRANLPASLSFVALETTRYAFTLIANTTTNTVNFTNVMVEEGDIDTAFEAYDATAKEVSAAFSNTRKAAIPTVYASAAMTVENGHNLATLSPGANVLPEFSFVKGENTLIFKGNGSAVVEWKEGGL